MGRAVIYAMAGTIGSGKTTYAKKLATEKQAMLFCIDESVKQLGLPLGSKEAYDKYYFGVRTLITDYAIKSLKLGTSVVFDFGGSRGHWDWLRSIAESTNSEVEITHLVAPLEVRRDRVKRRNLDPDVIFRFSDEAFSSMPTESVTPDVQPGLKITLVQAKL